MSDEELYHLIRDLRWDFDALDQRLGKIEQRLDAMADAIEKQQARAKIGKQKPSREERRAAAEEALLRVRDRLLGPKAPPAEPE